MKTVLFLLVMFKGEIRYFAEVLSLPEQCREELVAAVTEFKANPEINIIRAECIPTGRVASRD